MLFLWLHVRRISVSLPARCPMLRWYSPPTKGKGILIEKKISGSKQTPLRLSMVLRVAKPISLLLSPGNINSSFSISFSNCASRSWWAKRERDYSIQDAVRTTCSFSSSSINGSSVLSHRRIDRSCAAVTICIPLLVIDMQRISPQWP